MLLALMGDGGMLALRGAVTSLFGLAALIWPSLTLWVLVILLWAYVLIDGTVTLVAVVTRAPGTGARLGWLTFEGIVSVGVSFVTFVWPDGTALALLWLIAAGAFLTGVLELSLTVRLRMVIDREWLLGLAGVLSIVFAIILAVDPGSGVLGITWAIAWYALVSGGLYLSLAWRVRRFLAGDRQERVMCRLNPRPLRGVVSHPVD